MRIAALIAHTAEWTGIPQSQVRTIARGLQAAELVSSAGQDPRGATLTTSDKINLLLGALGVSTANRAADQVRTWRRLTADDVTRKNTDQEFALFRAKTLPEFLSKLIGDISSGGPLDTWLQAGSDHEITLDFLVDEFEFVFRASRLSTSPIARAAGQNVEQIEITFGQRRSKTGQARSQLIRRLPGESLRGWSTCLTETREAAHDVAT
jgi:hypothetical protein